MNIESLKIKKSILPYFKYYAGIYKPEKDGNNEIITIPIKDGSRALDVYYIKPLLESGYIWKESFLLGEIYLIKKL
jgi:hypothetical protein